MSEIIYRKAKEEDAYQIEYVAAHSWKETYSGFMPDEYLNNRILNINNKIEIVKEKIKDTDTYYYVAEVDKNIVGILYLTESKDEKLKNYGHLEALYVLKDYQGLGIGKGLFKIAIKEFINLGYNDMYLECLKGNKTIEFYQKYSGKIIDTIDFPIRDFNVIADIVEFNDIKSILQRLDSNNEITKRI